MTDLLLATHHLGGGWFPFFPLFFIGLWIVVFFVFGRRRWHHSDRRSGESVLAERYARGEITEAEYRERRQVLRQR